MPVDEDKLREQYEVTGEAPIERITWAVVGDKGAIHIWAQYHDPESLSSREYGDVCYGGIETHWRQPPDYYEGEPPHHGNCWLLKSPCWHDGSSLYFSEHLEPLVRALPRDALKEHMMLEARRWYRDQFEATP